MRPLSTLSEDEVVLYNKIRGIAVPERIKAKAESGSRSTKADINVLVDGKLCSLLSLSNAYIR